MITIFMAIVLGIMALGFIAGLFIFGIGALASIFVFAVKAGVCAIPIAIGILFVKVLFGI